MTAKPSLVHQIEFPRNQAVSMDVLAFDEAFASQGVQLVHWRSMRCPVGLTDRYDNRRPDHGVHPGCNNGFIYTKAGVCTALFTGNGLTPHVTDAGVMDGSTVQVSVQRFYDDSRATIQVTPFDRMYLLDDSIAVPTWQLFEASIDGRDRTQYPVVEVQDLMGADGTRYEVDRDFVVEDGYIRWTGPNRPRYKADLQRGEICSVRYTHRPYWLVKQLVHQIRVTQAEVNGVRQVVRMPQAMVLQREYVADKAEAPIPEGEDVTNHVGQQPAPRSGSLGPR